MGRLALRLIAAAWLGAWACAGQAQVSADEVKAAFLYNFARFTEWPGKLQPARELVIGVVGAPGIEAQLHAIAAERNRAPRLSVRALAPEAPLSGVHIVYVGSAQAGGLEALVRQARRHHVLVVSDAPGALARGAVINFVALDQRVRFEISLAAAEMTGLRLSARLLSVAMRVRKGEAPEDTLLALLYVRPFRAG